MNWKRGFIRLWVAFAACWVIGTSINIGHDLVSMQFIGDRHSDCRPYMAKPEIKTTPLDRKDCYDIRNYEADWATRKATAGVFIIPPVLLLLFGIVVAWIIRGFRKGPIQPQP